MKRLLLVVVCLVMAAGAYAQDIVGQWVQERRQTENGMTVAITETFAVSVGGMFEQGVVMEMKMADSPDGQKPEGNTEKTFRLRISCKGGWTLADGVMTQTFDVKSIRTEVLEQPEGTPKFLLNMLGKTVSSEFKKQSKKPYRSKVITLTSDKLVVQSLDDKDSETTTYTRKI